jgi:FMN-dependent NADH-azoreductase
MAAEKVYRAWVSGEVKADGNLRTDGQTFFSYTMPIGRKTNGKVLVVGGRGPSVTTSKHINYLKRMLGYSGIAYEEVAPEVLK